MTVHVCILGIDGSGKSTVTAALPSVLAAEIGSVVGSASEAFRVVSPDEDHLGPAFYPDGSPAAARLSMRLKRTAKRLVDNSALYPFFKLPQMLMQDRAARKLARRYACKVFVSDGNAFLSTTGRAANYLRAASANIDSPAPDAEDLRVTFSYIFDDAPVPEASREKLPALWKGKLIYKLNNLLRLNAVWLPDVVIFLDLSPELAVTRIKCRRQKIDHHENLADLGQARDMYLKTLDAFQRYRSPEVAHRIEVDKLTPGETIRAVIEALRPHLVSSGPLRNFPLPLERVGVRAYVQKKTRDIYFAALPQPLFQREREFFSKLLAKPRHGIQLRHSAGPNLPMMRSRRRP